MTWLRWAAFALALIGLRWVIAHRGEDAAAYILAPLFGVVLLAAYFRHARKQHTELTIMQAEPDERAALLAAMSPARAAEVRFTLRSFADIDLSAAPSSAEFGYPVAPRRLTAVLFWASVICTAGLLLPIIRGQADWSSTLMLLIVAGIFFLMTLSYRITHRWTGTRLVVTEEALTELSPDGSQKQIAWSEMTAVRARGWRRSLEYEAATGERIRVGLNLKAFAHFVQLTLIHLYRRSGASAT